MQSRFARRAGRRLAVLAAVAAVLVVAVPATAQAASGDLKVMTRNLYLGTGLDNVVQATDFNSFVGAVTLDYFHVVQTSFPTRAEALADEIAAARPDLVGLQEVSLWRDQFPADSPPPPFGTGNATPNATHVTYDFLALLRAALAARGLRYSAAATSVNADVEAPRLTNFVNTAAGLTDVRLTDRDVILKNDDTPGLTLSGAADGRYATQLTVNSLAGPVQFTRGWAYVDGKYQGKTFRFFNTHLEVEGAGPIQVAQGGEVVAGPLNTKRQTIMVCDCNSAADGSNTATYANLVGAGFDDAWTAAGSGAEDTCCQHELLSNLTSQLHERIDLVLTRSHPQALSAQVVGNTPFRTSPAPPYWASDHAGVVATISLK